MSTREQGEIVKTALRNYLGDVPMVDSVDDLIDGLMEQLETALRERDENMAEALQWASKASELQEQLEAADRALRWYEEHRDSEGNYDGLMYGPLDQISNPAKEPS